MRQASKQKAQQERHHDWQVVYPYIYILYALLVVWNKKQTVSPSIITPEVVPSA
jgi:hypothetical protein